MLSLDLRIQSHEIKKKKNDCKIILTCKCKFKKIEQGEMQIKNLELSEKTKALKLTSSIDKF
jgi:hypothetical protein